MSSVQIVFISVLVISLIYLVTISIIFSLKEKIDSIDTQIYKKIIIINVISLVLELLLYIMGGKAIPNQRNSFMSFFLAFSKIFTGFICLWFYAMFKYTKAIYYKQKSIVLDKNKERNYDLIMMFLGLIILLLPTDFIVTNGVGYTSGPSTKFAGLLMTLSCCAMVYFLLKSKSFLKNKEFIPIILSVISLIITVIVQMMNPSLLLFNPIITLVTIIMYHTIENPDVRLIEQLDVAKKQAEKANHAKTDFLSSMSHEIRTPLNAIVGFSDCILDSNNLSEAKENAKDIVNASQTLLEIVNGILDISKIEAGKIEIVNSPYNAPEIFKELATLITPKMHEKGLDFTYNIAPDLPKTLYGDHANIRKVVTNLLSNAAKYTEHGFVHYEVNCINNKDYTKLIISVEDSGRGIKKDSIDKLFTKFQRLDEDRNTTIEGTGLGLAITKQLTELMGGKIIVHTVYGEGSKFTVVINQRIERVEVKDTKKAKTTLDLHDVRIMIVDDTPLNLKVTCKLFERYNANHVVTCNSGFECLDRIKRGEIYDIILLDDMMPKMSGVETLAKLKELSEFKTPTVALTANAITGMREKYLADGFNDYLAKPIEKDEMIRVINECLGRSQTEELSAVTNFINSEDHPDQAAKVDDWSNKQVRDAVLEVSNSTDTAQEDRNKIIPVEENIEEILGSKLDLTDDTKEFTVSMNPVKVDHIDEVEQLEEEESTTPVMTEIVPVVDINVPTETHENIEETPTIEEKVERVEEVAPIETVAPVENINTNETFDRAYLEKNGADINHALELLGDMDMYNATINDFAKEVDEKWDRINSEKTSNDMENYAIDVHSLKSDCKYLGFMGLADIAYQHELKSKENDSNYVNEHFAELETEYRRVLEVVKKYVEHNPYTE